MIAKLTGVIDSLKEDSLILDVNGVGYLVFVSTSLLPKISLKQKIALFIETQVREDSITLFGFTIEEDKKLFNLLKTVQGVGPKLALAIMALSSSDILNAIMLQDPKKLQVVSGVGAKVAARTVSELKDKVGKIFDINIHKEQPNYSNYDGQLISIVQEAVAALKSLGYSDKEAEAAVNKVVRESSSNVNNKTTYNVEEIIKQALNYFSAKI